MTATLVLVGLGFAGGAWLHLGDPLGLEDATHAHLAARGAFLADLTSEGAGCVTRDAVIAEAQARGWYRGEMEEFPWCIRPAGLSGWLHVDVSPPMPFSTEGENAAYVGFDAQGCMAEWRYDRGPGTTCPDS